MFLGRALGITTNENRDSNGGCDILDNTKLEEYGICSCKPVNSVDVSRCWRVVWMNTYQYHVVVQLHELGFFMDQRLRVRVDVHCLDAR